MHAWLSIQGCKFVENVFNSADLYQFFMSCHDVRGLDSPLMFFHCSFHPALKFHWIFQNCRKEFNTLNKSSAILEMVFCYQNCSDLLRSIFEVTRTNKKKSTQTTNFLLVNPNFHLGNIHVLRNHKGGRDYVQY